MTALDRPGIFKARPTQWRVKTNDKTSSVSVAVEYVVTAELNDWNTCGSASSCSVPMIEKMPVSTSAGTTSGILIDHAMRSWLAPSRRAAS